MKSIQNCHIGITPPIIQVVCKLKNYLYDLKQSSIALLKKSRLNMKKYGYSQSNAIHILFFKKHNKKINAFFIYVDEIIVMSNDTNEMKILKTYLSSKFDIKNLGSLKCSLGIEVIRSKQG